MNLGAATMTNGAMAGVPDGRYAAPGSWTQQAQQAQQQQAQQAQKAQQAQQQQAQQQQAQQQQAQQQQLPAAGRPPAMMEMGVDPYAQAEAAAAAWMGSGALPPSGAPPLQGLSRASMMLGGSRAPPMMPQMMMGPMGGAPMLMGGGAGWHPPFYTHSSGPSPSPAYSRPPSLSELLHERFASTGPGTGVVLGPGAGGVSGPVTISGPPGALLAGSETWSMAQQQQVSHLPTTLFLPHGAGSPTGREGTSLSDPEPRLNRQSMSSTGTAMGPVGMRASPTGEAGGGGSGAGGAVSSHTSHPHHMSAEERKEARRQARLKAKGTGGTHLSSGRAAWAVSRSVPNSPPQSPSRPSHTAQASAVEVARARDTLAAPGSPARAADAALAAHAAAPSLAHARGDGGRTKVSDGHQAPKPKKSSTSSSSSAAVLRATSDVKSCFNCRTTTTPMWRRGQCGNHSVVLCNACGVRFKKGRLMTVHDKDVFHAASVLSDLLTSSPRSPRPPDVPLAPTA